MNNEPEKPRLTLTYQGVVQELPSTLIMQWMPELMWEAFPQWMMDNHPNWVWDRFKKHPPHDLYHWLCHKFPLKMSRKHFNILLDQNPKWIMENHHELSSERRQWLRLTRPELVPEQPMTMIIGYADYCDDHSTPKPYTGKSYRNFGNNS